VSKIPKVGLHIIALLMLTCLASFGARLANQWRTARQEMPSVPDHFDVDRFRWQGVESGPPVSDGERDRPHAVNRVYQLGTQSPVFVSVARVNTLNGLSSPGSYLMDTDGRILQGDKLLIRPAAESRPHYVMEIAQGHDNTILLIHWVQAPNMPGYVDFTGVPKSVAKSLLLHSALYSCDVWVPLRSDSNGAFLRKTLVRFANVIEAQIQTGHMPVDTNANVPAPSDLNNSASPMTVPSPTISPLATPGTPSPLSPTVPGSTPGAAGDGFNPVPSISSDPNNRL
jgi:hypothetical protein